MERLSITDDERLNTMARGGAAGAIAGTVFAAAQMGAALIGDYSVVLPWRHAASILVDRAAFTMPVGLVVMIGFFVHMAIAGTWGMLGGALHGWTEWGSRAQLGALPMTALGASFGAFVWLVDLAIVGQALYPWAWRYDQVIQLALHVVFYGATLGAVLAALEQQQTARIPTGTQPWNRPLA